MVLAKLLEKFNAFKSILMDGEMIMNRKVMLNYTRIDVLFALAIKPSMQKAMTLYKVQAIHGANWSNSAMQAQVPNRQFHR